jgi:uncharacterized membrane protein YccC
MIDALKALLRKNGYLSQGMVAAATNIPSPNTYRLRFGSLTRAFQLAGLTEDTQLRRDRPQRSYEAITRALTDQELLARLRKLLETRGALNQAIINEAHGVPCVETYRRRFGTLYNAYYLIGYEPAPLSRRYSKEDLIKLLRKCLRENGRISGRLLTPSEGFPTASTYQSRFGSLRRAYKMIGYKAQKTSCINRFNSSDQNQAEVLKRVATAIGMPSRLFGSHIIRLRSVGSGIGTPSSTRPSM